MLWFVHGGDVMLQELGSDGDKSCYYHFWMFVEYQIFPVDVERIRRLMFDVISTVFFSLRGWSRYFAP
jgi:hypothetical protein